MNFLWTSFIISIFLFDQKILGGEEETYRQKTNAQLGLIQEKNSPKLKLAIPHKVESRFHAGYFYDDKGERGPEQKFKTACPAYTRQEGRIETEWRTKANASKKSAVFFLEEKTNVEKECKLRHDPPVPSIQITNRDCGNLHGKIYEVGYPVSLSREKENNKIQFMPIYEICYSEGYTKEGVIYTIHRIDSPSLMALETYENYEPDLSLAFPSPFDQHLKTVKSLNKKNHTYQFVPRYDMPTILWEHTTLFLANFISAGPTSPEFNLFKGMLKYDYIVRLVSNKNEKKFTFYSGAHERTEINSVWKVIIDEDKKATMLVTQITKTTCDKTTFYLCNQDFEVLEYYKDGGCTYKCFVNDAVLSLLHLPKLGITGNLELAYTKPVEQEAEEISKDREGREGQNNAKNPKSLSEKIDISDFEMGKSFLAALMHLDPKTASTIKIANSLGFREIHFDNVPSSVSSRSFESNQPGND